MLGRNLVPLMLLALVAATALPRPAAAQCRLCAEPTTAPTPQAGEGSPLRLEVLTTLDFDRLILLGTGSGSAILNPDGTSRAIGSIASVSGRAMVGEIVIRGEPGRAVRVELPRAIELYGLKGGAIHIERLASDLADYPTLDGAGELKVRIGGELKVSGDVDGDFRGDVAIIVDYL